MRSALPLLFVLAATGAHADPPEIVAAEARRDGAGWHFDVTLRHPDSGWDHFADAWAVLAPDGRELGRRVLLHPHETEQPFTRSLGGVEIPDELSEVVIRAHCSDDGWATTEMRLPLAR